MIYFQNKDESLQKIYQERQSRNTETTLEFELEKSGQLTVFFNEEKALEIEVDAISEKDEKDERI